jgi:hypothetical protein
MRMRIRTLSNEEIILTGKPDNIGKTISLIGPDDTAAEIKLSRVTIDGGGEFASGTLRPPIPGCWICWLPDGIEVATRSPYPLTSMNG